MVKTLLRFTLILVALLMLAVAAAMMLAQTSAGSSFVENRLRAWIHPSLQINGPVEVTVFPGLGLDVRDLAIDGTSVLEHQQEGGSVSVARLRVQVQWLPLLERKVHIDDLYIQGIRLSQVNAKTDASGKAQDDAGSRAADRATQMWRISALKDWFASGWQLSLSHMMIEDVAIMSDGQASQTSPVLLVSLRQLQVAGDVAWPLVADGNASLGIREFSVNDPEALGNTPALLEQLGIATNGAWDIATLDSQWRVDDAAGQSASMPLVLESLTATGMWGEMSASSGRIDLQTGQIAIPMQAVLTNAPKFQGRGFEINVRQSRMRFELTGTLKEPGLQWLNQTRSNR